MRLIPPQYKWGAIALAFLLWTAGTMGWAFHYGGKSERLKCIAAQAKALREQQRLLQEAQQAAAKQAAALQRNLDRLPKAEGKTNEVVRANPAQCERPAAVADSLQDAVREANAARALPGNP